VDDSYPASTRNRCIPSTWSGSGSSAGMSVSILLACWMLYGELYLSLPAGQSDVDKAAGVQNALAGTALGRLGLFLLVDLGCGGLDLAWGELAEVSWRDLD
jgi:hypothetical protein